MAPTQFSQDPVVQKIEISREEDHCCAAAFIAFALPALSSPSQHCYNNVLSEPPQRRRGLQHSVENGYADQAAALEWTPEELRRAVCPGPGRGRAPQPSGPGLSAACQVTGRRCVACGAALSSSRFTCIVKPRACRTSVK